jgi:DNA-binding transcriptional ArsR family regulator
LLEILFQGKIRVKLLTRILLNPKTTVYLRGLEKELGVSSNTVRLELNKLKEAKLIELADEDGNQKQYRANVKHPLFDSLRNLILKQIGFDELINTVFDNLGDVESVYLTNDWAEGKESPFIDLVVVGNIDKEYMSKLIEKAESIINRKIRVAVYDSTFDELLLVGQKKVRIV